MTVDKNFRTFNFAQIAELVYSLVKEKYPMLSHFQLKKKKNVYHIRAKYGDRRLYACNETIEETVMHFFFEINRKVFLEKYVDSQTFNDDPIGEAVKTNKKEAKLVIELRLFYTN